MKLFYSTGACSLAPHIVLREAGLDFELVQASTKTHQLNDGSDYYQINPKGYVPFLVFDDGQTLSEGPVIAQWIADQVPEKPLLPPFGSLARYRVLEWQNFISTELHKLYSPLFNPAFPEEGKEISRKRLLERYALVDQQLAQQPYLTGEQFTVADAYLFVVTRWAKPLNLDLSAFTHLYAFMTRVAQRPSVQQALAAEGIV